MILVISCKNEFAIINLLCTLPADRQTEQSTEQEQVRTHERCLHTERFGNIHHCTEDSC